MATQYYDSGMAIEELFPDDSIQDHVLSTDMWAGSHDPIDSYEYVVRGGQIVQTTVQYPPSLYKCIDEAIVNALDNMIRMKTATGDNSVTNISVKFNRNGRIIVRNDGRGVPVGWHSKANKYSVELIFGTMFKGRAKTDRDSKVTGDANRVGIKIANILSTEFIISTVHLNDDGVRTRYSQRWFNHMREFDKPVVVNDVSDRQFTEVSFMPDYSGVFKMKFDDSVYNTLNELFKFRCYTAAAYAGYYTKGKCCFSYQGTYVPIKSITDMAKLMYLYEDVDENGKPLPSPPLLATNVGGSGNSGNSDQFSWELAVVVTPNNATSKKNLAQISNVNGVNVRGGRHVQYIADQIISGVKDVITKKLKSSDIKWQPSYVYNNLMIYLNSQIPGVRWEGQRKDEAVADAKKIAQYQLLPSFINRIANALEERILSSIYDTTSVTGAEKRKKFKLDKYEPAKKAGTKQSQKCWLLLPEGDSAGSMCSTGITHINPKTKKPFLGFEYYGYMTLGGVIVNARKGITIKVVGGKKCINLSDSVADNKFFSSFLDAVGLDLNAKYEPDSPTYNKEMAALKYGAIIACVDQDHDGSGFIFPLLVNLFEIFWPNLLRAGFVKKWDTPRRRAIPKSGGKILDFYYDHDFEAWQRADPSHTTANYTIDYIKGLAGHEDRAVTHMFEHFHSNVITYDPDASTNESFEIMFGKLSAPRKTWLKTPIVIPDDRQIMMRQLQHRATCSSLIHCEGKEHALSNLQQKLWSAIDGMNESGRKILDGSLKVFANSLKKTKVAILAGHIIAKEHYEHGEASIQESIVGKALLCVGGVQLPQLLPRSNFGTRKLGGGIKDGDSGKPRYVFTTLNKKLTDLIYPRADYPNYEFVDADGSRAEPKYFVPIIPMAVLESTHIPAHGWKIQTWARDVFAVIRCVRYLIMSYSQDTGIDELLIGELPPETRGFTGEFREIRGVTHCFGNYHFNPKTRLLTITELPLRTWTEKYKRSLTKENTVKSPNADKSIYKQYGNYINGKSGKRFFISEIKMFAREPANHSSKNNVHIEIQIAKPDPKTGYDPIDIIESYADMHFADGFEEYFELHTHMHHNLCMIATDGSVIDFDTYEDVVKYWFVERKRYYELRINRQIIILKLEIQLMENIIRYVREYKEMKITKVADEIAEGILESRNYDRFNKTWLKSGGYIGGNADRYIPTKSLETTILNSGHASYDYLLNTTDREKLNKSIAAREQKLANLQEQLEQLKAHASQGKFPGAQMWLDELSAAAKVIRQGFDTNWEFENKNKFRYE